MEPNQPEDKRSRHIPIAVERQVKAKHYLECAWDGTRLLEQHHIHEFHLGGLHTVENLILLCPNCHTQVHQGKITESELIERQLTHSQGDRRNITAPFNVQEPIIKLGGNTFEKTPILIQVGGVPLLFYTLAANGEILFSARMYNRDGELIFWMSDNRIVMPSWFRIIAENKQIEIKDTTDPNSYIKIWQDDEDTLNVLANTYVAGIPFEITPESLVFGQKKQMTMTGGYIVGSKCAFDLAKPPLMVRSTINIPLRLDEEWPPAGNQLLINSKMKDADQSIQIGALLEGQLFVQVNNSGKYWHTKTQRLAIPINCSFNLTVEIYPQRIEVLINGAIIPPADAHEHMIPIHTVACISLETDSKKVEE